MDLGNFSAARRYFEDALSVDSGFLAARNRIVTPELYAVTQISNVVQMNSKVAQLLGSVQFEGETGSVSDFTVKPSDRLQEMGLFMDAGFIPSNDSRKAYEEAVALDAVIIEPTEKMLVDPPLPPFIPDQWFLPGPPTPPNKP
jgi:hypothetical protein